MRRKQGKVLRLGAILLLSAVLVGEFAGLLQGQKIGSGDRRGTFILADGPCPVPTPPPIRS